MSAKLESFIQRLRPYQVSVENAMQKRIDIWGNPSQLQKACIYALSQGGKRFRPALAMMVADALPAKLDVTDAALAIEYFHTASLIADDLPCMDNEVERRGKPPTHLIYGESTALLASYALISAGYAAIATNTNLLKKHTPLADQVGVLALQQAAYLTGIHGTTGGQHLDLFPPTQDLFSYKETAIKKTVSLFEISMLFGWLFGGGDPQKLSIVTEAAQHYGLAFQIKDDQDDLEKDILEKRTLNAYYLLGNEEAKALFESEIQAYLQCLNQLDIASEDLTALASM